MAEKLENYVFNNVVKPVMDGTTILYLKEIIEEFDKIDDPDKNDDMFQNNTFYFTLSAVYNSLQDYKTNAMFWTPHTDNIYRGFLSLLKNNSIDENLMNSFIELSFKNFLIANLGFRSSPEFMIKYFLNNNQNLLERTDNYSSEDASFPQFITDINKIKCDDGLKTQLWLFTHFNLLESTHLFKTIYDSKFFDKIMVCDVTSYGFLLDKKRLDEQKEPLCYIGKDLVL